MQAYTQTALQGGVEGVLFNDVCFLEKNKGLILSTGQLQSNSLLSMDRPICEIRVSSGWIVDGIAIDYRTKSGDVLTYAHGSQFTGRQCHKVALNANERIVAVFGRAGYQTFYKRSMVNCIGFVIMDTKTAMTRVEGPFGNENGSNDGEAFEAHDVVACGGFAQDTDTLGLSGLWFVQNVHYH